MKPVGIPPPAKTVAPPTPLDASAMAPAGFKRPAAPETHPMGRRRARRCSRRRPHQVQCRGRAGCSRRSPWREWRSCDEVGVCGRWGPNSEAGRTTRCERRLDELRGPGHGTARGDPTIGGRRIWVEGCHEAKAGPSCLQRRTLPRGMGAASAVRMSLEQKWRWTSPLRQFLVLAMLTQEGRDRTDGSKAGRPLPLLVLPPVRRKGPGALFAASGADRLRSTFLPELGPGPILLPRWRINAAGKNTPWPCMHGNINVCAHTHTHLPIG